MLAYTYISKGNFKFQEKPIPQIEDSRDAIVRVTLSSICTSDLHIKHGSVPRAVPGITVGHEMVGIVEQTGADVTTVKPGDRVTVNVETFCGECFFCKKGFVNNCTDPNGGWALGCRIDGGQAEYVRIPYADSGLNRIPDAVSDEQALFVGDVLATGFWAARISEITEDDTVLIIGAGPTGICTLLCVMLKNPKRIIICEKSPERIQFVRAHYPDVLITEPETCQKFVLEHSDPWWGRCRTRSCRKRYYFPYGMGMRPPQRYCNCGCPLRQTATFTITRYVWQKPHIQNRRCGWLRLYRNPSFDRRRQN